MTPIASAVLRHVGVAALGVALLGSCAALPPMPPRAVTTALDSPADTTLGRRVGAERGGARGSGLRLLADGEEALATLIAMADATERTLDLQYYAVLNDASSRVLLQHVRAAAERGVRVRLLVDDFNTSGTDEALLRLTRHPRIEVRLYNPLPAGRMSTLTKVLASLHDFDRINSRMHNKAFIADNALAVTGGRNLGDPYFVQTEEANFVDLDVLAAGPVVRALSAVFDRFWNSELAYPAAALVPGWAAAASAPAATASAPALDSPDRLPPASHAEVARHVAAWEQALRLQWAPARLIADLPSKTLAQGDPNDAETMFDDLGALLRSAKREVLLVTPYFVPGDDGMALIASLRRRGVRVRVLTASFAATDAPIVHVGYSRYREALLDAGVELHELHPSFVPERRRGGVHSRTNLHSKAIVVDGHTALIGSMNLDPRSDKLNTEMGLLVRSPVLGERLLALMAHAIERGAWRVERDGDGLRWTMTGADGRVETSEREPRASPLKLLALRLLAPLAPERML